MLELELWIAFNSMYDRQEYSIYNQFTDKRTVWLTIQQLLDLPTNDRFYHNRPTIRAYTAYPILVASTEELPSLPTIYPELFI